MSVTNYLNDAYDKRWGNDRILRSLEEAELFDIGDVLRPSLFYREEVLLQVAGSARNDLLPNRHPAALLLRRLIREKKPQPSRVERVSVTKLDGVMSSKAWGCASLAELACSLLTPENYDRDDGIEFQTDADFARNIERFEFHFRPHDYPIAVLHRMWDDKLFVVNNGASHRLAALYRQCNEQGRAYRFDARVHRVVIDRESASSLIRDYHLLLMHKKTFDDLFDVLDSQIGFRYDSKMDYTYIDVGSITFGTDHNTILLCLRRDQRYAPLINSWLLLRSLPEQVFDFSSHLRHSLMRQDRRFNRL